MNFSYTGMDNSKFINFKVDFTGFLLFTALAAIGEVTHLDFDSASDPLGPLNSNLPYLHNVRHRDDDITSVHPPSTLRDVVIQTCVICTRFGCFSYFIKATIVF
jgi:hypothetical protein